MKYVIEFEGLNGKKKQTKPFEDRMAAEMFLMMMNGRGIIKIVD